MTNVPTLKRNNNGGKNALSVIVVALFSAAMVAKYITKDYDIPFGLEIAFMTVCGWVFGSTFTDTLKSFLGNKRRKK